ALPRDRRARRRRCRPARATSARAAPSGAWPSSVITEDVREIAEHRLDRARGRAHRGDAGGTDGDEAPRLAAALRSRLAQRRRHQPLGLEALYRRVDVGAAHGSAGALLDVVGDGDGVGLIGSETERGQQDEELEFSEGGRGRRHLTHYVTIPETAPPAGKFRDVDRVRLRSLHVASKYGWP